MEQIQTIETFEEACAAKGLDPQKVLPDVTAFPQQHQKALLALAKLIIIIDALNGDWQPDWNNYDERKYFLWFDMETEENTPSGFRLGCAACNCTASRVGSRLCFRSRELAEYAGEQFIDLYKDYMAL
jgi:hypothetical protein